jgi:hypothetical protein
LLAAASARAAESEDVDLSPKETRVLTQSYAGHGMGAVARIMLCSLLTVGPIAPAAAQIRDVKRATDVPTNQGYDFVRCELAGHRLAMEKILSFPPQSRGEDIAGRQVDAGNCLSDKRTGMWLSVNFQGQAYRGMLAELLLLKDFSAIGTQSGKHMVHVFPAVPAAQLASLPLEQKAPLMMLTIAECAVRVEPAKAFEVFKTAFGSPEEKAAIKSLLPAFENCFPEGEQLTLNFENARYFLAEASYRVSVELANKVNQ